MLAEPEAPFVTAAFTAADSTGFDLSALALRDELDPQGIYLKGGA